MKKKLTAALLALTMVLALLPAAAVAAEPKTPKELISSVNYYYRSPDVSPEGNNWESRNTLRNVFSVKLLTTTSKETMGTYSFAVKAGTAGDSANTYHDVEKVFISEPILNDGKYSVAYFEAPKDVISADQKTYTIRITDGEGNYDEKTITLYKVTFKANDDTKITGSWIDGDEGRLLTDTDGNPCILVSPSDSYPAFPTLNDKTDGNKKEFIGWAEQNGETTSKLIANIKQDTTLYAVFGERARRVLTVRTEDNAETGVEVSYGNPVTHNTEYGTQTTLDLYIRNEGNVKFEKVYTSSTNHMDLTYVAEQQDGVTEVLDAGRKCYNIEAGKALKVQFTPKENLPQGTYTDRVTLHNDTDHMIRYIEITLEVTPIKVEITAENITKTYGETKSSADVKWQVVDRSDAKTIQKALQNGISFTSDGFEAKANAKENGYDITIQNAVTGNYSVSWKDNAPKVIVSKAKPKPSTNDPEVSLMQGHPLKDVTPAVEFTDPTTGDPITGTIKWTDDTTSWANPGENYTAQFTFTPDNANYETYTGTAKVHVSEKHTVNLVPKEGEAHSVTYDGQTHELTFQIVPDHDYDDADISEIQGITVTYQKQGEEGEPTEQPPTDAGVYTVTASTKDSHNFAADTSTATLTIHPQELTVTATVEGKTYDGTTTVDVSKVTVNVTGKVGTDEVNVTPASAAFDNANAGTDKTVTVTLGTLTGAKAGNYTLPTGGTVTATASITKKAVTLKLKDGTTLTKTYGELFVLNLTEQFEADGLVAGELLGTAVTGTLSCEGVGETAVVKDGGYEVTFAADEGNYEVTLAETKLTVTKATPKLHDGTIQTSTGWTGGTLETVTLTGEFVNASNESMIVKGKLEWADPTTSLVSAVDGTIEASWKFKPEDTNNYDGTELTGKVNVTVSKSKPITLNGVVPQTVTYNGTPQPYSVEITTTPADAEISLRYRLHMDTDADHENTESFNLEPPTNAGTYDVLVLAKPTENEKGEFKENSVIVHLIIEQADLKTENIGPFSGREGTKLSDLENLPTELPGIKEEKVPGAFAWTSPEATITAVTAEFGWSFIPENANYKAVTGQATVTMADDDRTVTGTVYNLPAGYVDYVTVDLSKHELLPGETVNFYSDAACKTSPLGTLVVPADVTSVEVHFAQDALDSKAGTIYAKIAGQKTTAAPLSYVAAVGPNITDQTATVGGTVTLTVEGAESVAWTVSASEAVTVPENLSGDTLTLTAAAVGTATVTVTATYAHPDKTKTAETVTVTKTVTVTVNAKAPSKPSNPTPVEPEPEPSLTPDTPVENGEATAQIAPEAVTDGIADAQKAGDDTVTVEPKLSDKADKVTVELPQASVDALADAELGLTVKTEDTSLTLSPDALADLNAAGGSTVSVTVETKDNGSTAIDVAVDGKSVTAVKGGVKAQLPAAGEGQVLVAVGPDGTETVIKKSVVEDGTVDALLEGSCTVKVADRAVDFEDVTAGSWYAGAVDFASGHELFNGTAPTTFAPQEPMTRGMVATVLWRLENEQDVTAAGVFTDVKDGSWYADGILWATHEGIVTGYGNGLCGPEDSVTREQLATMLHRYAKLMGLDLTVTGKLSDFADGTDVSDYAEDAMVWAVGTGLLQGGDIGVLDPHGDATRAQVATVLQRLITLMVK